MMDYNVTDHWRDTDPTWLKSLVSSLDRRVAVPVALPLTVTVGEIVDWVDLAGVEPFLRNANRKSLWQDYEQSRDAIGRSLRCYLEIPLRDFEQAWSRLQAQPRAILGAPPGRRTDSAWVNVEQAANELQAALLTDDAARHAWDDLVSIAQDVAAAQHEYQAVADLLFDQVERRGGSSKTIFSNIVSLLAYGREPGDPPFSERDTRVEERLAKARVMVGTAAAREPTVVWFAYKGRVHEELEMGPVTFYEAMVARAYADSDSEYLPHQIELRGVLTHGRPFRLFTDDDRFGVGTFVRVDLGDVPEANAPERALAIVDLLLDVAVQRGGGTRPQPVGRLVLRGGKAVQSSVHPVPDSTGFPDDSYGAVLTSDALRIHGPRLAEAVARQDLPRYLSAAVEAQTAADRPFSRDMARRPPSEADIASVVPLCARVVEHVAAHAVMTPEETYEALAQQWPHARWTADLHRAVSLCLIGYPNQGIILKELTRDWYSATPKQPTALFIADHQADLLSLCLVEHERAWIERMLDSVTNASLYAELIAQYEREAQVLGARRARVRNAVTHGNPVSMVVVSSVRDFAEFTSRWALDSALEAYSDGLDPAAQLRSSSQERSALLAGQDAANYWRNRIAEEGWPRAAAS